MFDEERKNAKWNLKKKEERNSSIDKNRKKLKGFGES